MTFGQKLKEIRKRLNLSQEQLAKILSVSRQAITKWEGDNGLPDIDNLKSLSKLLGITIDSLLDNSNLPLLDMKIELDRNKYSNKKTLYKDVLNNYFDNYNIYILSINKKLSKIEAVLNIFTGGDYDLIKGISDLSPYYLVIKENSKLLVNIKNNVLEVIELERDTNIKKFNYKDNIFYNCGKLKLREEKENE